MRRLVTALVIAILTAAASIASPRRSTRSPAGRLPGDGTRGRPLARAPERESEGAPTKAIAALTLRQGQVVADIGAGSGGWRIPNCAANTLKEFRVPVIWPDPVSRARFTQALSTRWH